MGFWEKYDKLRQGTKSIIRPFSIIGSEKPAFLLWMAFSLIGGAIGILVSILKHWLFTDGMSFIDAIVRECRNGSFYTYSIALFASSLSSVFISMLGHSTLSFRKRKIYVLSILIYALIFGGILYALSVDWGINMDVHTLSQKDWIELGVTLIAIIISVYAFCISKLDSHQDELNDIEDKDYTDKSLNELGQMGNDNLNFQLKEE